MRALAASGQADDAEADADAEFQYVLEVYSNSANSLNSFALRMVADPNEKLWHAPAAVQFASKAVELEPKNGLLWNTLGVAQYRKGDYEKAIESLAKSEEVLQDEQYSFNGFFLAMAHWQLDHKQEAKDFFEKSIEWMDANQPTNGELLRFKAEAAKLIDIADTP
jgi:tetratricopeptide (TPR) repeat protein